MSMHEKKEGAFVVTAGVLLAIVALYKQTNVGTGTLLDALNDLTTRKKTAKQTAPRAKRSKKPDTSKAVSGSQNRNEDTTTRKEEAAYFKSCVRDDVHNGVFSKKRIKAFEKVMETPKGRKKRLNRAKDMIKNNLQGDCLQQLLDSLRCIFARDATINDDDVVSLNADGSPMTKRELLNATALCPEAVLLGAWIFAVKRGDNKLGRAAYDELFPKTNGKCHRRPLNKSVDLTFGGSVDILKSNVPKHELAETSVFFDGDESEEKVKKIEQRVAALISKSDKTVSKTAAAKYAKKAAHHLLLAYCEMTVLLSLNARSEDGQSTSSDLKQVIRKDMEKQFVKYEKALAKEQSAIGSQGRIDPTPKQNDE